MQNSDDTKQSPIPERAKFSATFTSEYPAIYDYICTLENVLEARSTRFQAKIIALEAQRNLFEQDLNDLQSRSTVERNTFEAKITALEAQNVELRAEIDDDNSAVRTVARDCRLQDEAMIAALQSEVTALEAANQTLREERDALSLVLERTSGMLCQSLLLKQAPWADLSRAIDASLNAKQIPQDSQSALSLKADHPESKGAISSSKQGIPSCPRYALCLGCEQCRNINAKQIPSAAERTVKK